MPLLQNPRPVYTEKCETPVDDVTPPRRISGRGSKKQPDPQNSELHSKLAIREILADTAVKYPPKTWDGEAGRETILPAPVPLNQVAQHHQHNNNFYKVNISLSHSLRWLQLKSHPNHPRGPQNSLHTDDETDEANELSGSGRRAPGFERLSGPRICPKCHRWLQRCKCGSAWLFWV